MLARKVSNPAKAATATQINDLRFHHVKLESSFETRASAADTSDFKLSLEALVAVVSLLLLSCAIIVGTVLRISASVKAERQIRRIKSQPSFSSQPDASELRSADEFSNGTRRKDGKRNE